MAVAARGLRDSRCTGWLLIAIGLLTWTVGDALFTWFLGERFLSVADVFYLAAYPLLATGISLLVREPDRTARGALLDTAIVTVPVVLALWVACIEPLVTSPGESFLFRTVSWILMYAFFAAAALNPGRPDRQPRLLLLGATSVAASALVILCSVQGRIGLPVVAAAALAPLLILGRLGMLVAEHRRDSARVLNPAPS